MKLSIIQSHNVEDILKRECRGQNTDMILLFADASYFESESYEFLIVVGWIPLLDTKKDNGGLEVCVVLMLCEIHLFEILKDGLSQHSMNHAIMATSVQKHKTEMDWIFTKDGNFSCSRC